MPFEIGHWRNRRATRIRSRRYIIALLAFVLSLEARIALSSILLAIGIPYITFFPAIMVSAWYGGLGPGLLTMALSAVSSIVLFLASDGISTPELVSLSRLVLGGIIISWLNQALHRSDERTRDELLARQQSEDALKRSEQRFRALIENSSDAIALIDAHGTILYASASTARLLGHTPEKLVGCNAPDLVHPHDRQQAQERLAALLQHPRGMITIETRIRHRDGSWRWVESVATNMLEDPIIEAIVVNYRDTTERKRLEEQFLQAQKMEAVGRLAGGVAHDFNNLLTVINGYSALALETLGKDNPLHDSIEEINKAGTSAASLTKQLLAFSRRQILEPKVINLNNIVSDMDRMLRRVIGEDIDLVTVLDPSLEAVKVDPGQIEQILMNLVVNSRDAMPDGGQLTIETANVELDDAYAREHRQVVLGPYAMLAVSDTGSGMDAQTQARIFEPFFTTKEQGEGTGLGLAMVYGFVKQSAGNIWVYSEPGKGTTFKIYLPKAHEGGADRIARRPTARSVQGSETVLAVEDDDSVRRLVCSVLRQAGYTVLEARDGGAAALVCENYVGPIHLIISDVVMPQMSGREFVDRVLSLRPAVKVIFMSGYTDTAIVRHGILDAETHFLQKPFTPAGLANKVRDVLDSGAVSRQAPGHLQE